MSMGTGRQVAAAIGPSASGPRYMMHRPCGASKSIVPALAYTLYRAQEPAVYRPIEEGLE